MNVSHLTAYLQERFEITKRSANKVNTVYKSKDDALKRALAIDPYSRPVVYETLHRRGLKQTQDGLHSPNLSHLSGFTCTYDAKLSFDLPDLLTEDQANHIAASATCPVLLMHATQQKLVEVRVPHFHIDNSG